MKKFLLFIVCVLIFGNVIAQDGMPKYYDVLKKYFTTYADEEDYENYTNFAKKKDGWYVQKINQHKNDKVLTEYLFWDIETKAYKDIRAHYNEAEKNVAWEKEIDKYLNYEWYGYDRVRYYGYNDWALDMINDFGNKENLSDTMYDGLCRAYGRNGFNYFWYQQGGSSDNKDSLQILLKRLQMPSNKRIEKVEESILKSIACAKKAAEKNSNYENIVGIQALKVFNEQMNGYSQMYIAGDNVKMQNFLDLISIDEKYILQAKNYLNSCQKNSILFTYGDNDTYQLWYVQQKLNYRKDVLVINTSLLGVPSYIKQLQKREGLKIAVPDSFLEDYGSDVSYYKEDDKNKKPYIPLYEFLQSIYFKRNISDQTLNLHPEAKVAAYSAKELRLENPFNTSISFKINLRSYTFLFELIMLDIVQSNIKSKSIQFTTNYGDNYFEKYLAPVGICYKLNMQKEIDYKKEINDLENFIETKYVLITSNYKIEPNFILFDGDNSFVSMYTNILKFYELKKDKVNFKKWINKFMDKVTNFSIRQIPSLRIAEEMILKSENKKAALRILELDAEYTFLAYTNPKYHTSFYSKFDCKMHFKRLQLLLDNANLKSTYIQNILLKLN